jgi:hypothetical protein
MSSIRAFSRSAEASPSLPRSAAISSERTPAGGVQTRKFRVEVRAQPGSPNHSLADRVVNMPSATSMSGPAASSRMAQPAGAKPTVLRGSFNSSARRPLAVR